MKVRFAQYTGAMVGALALLWGMAGIAQAKVGKSYVALSAGMGLKDTKPGSNVSGTPAFKEYWKKPITMSAAFGYNVGRNFRAEAEVSYANRKLGSIKGSNFHSTDAGGVGAKEWTLMANGYYDFKNSTKITPYIGVGIGAAKVVRDAGTLTLSTGGTSKLTKLDENAFAWQFKAGAAYQMTQSTALTVGYRYIDVRKKGLSNNIRFNSALEIGLRYGF